MRDFFGIAKLTTKDIAGTLAKSRLPTESISTKFGLLMQARNSLQNKEVTHNIRYGTVRYDGDNQPKEHGQYELRNTKPLFTTTEITQAFSSRKIEETEEPEYESGILPSEVGPETSINEILRLFRSEDTQNKNEHVEQIPVTSTKSSSVPKYETRTVPKPAFLEKEAPLKRPSKSRSIDKATVSSLDEYHPQSTEDFTYLDRDQPHATDDDHYLDLDRSKSIDDLTYPDQEQNDSANDDSFPDLFKPQFKPPPDSFPPKVNALQYLKDIRAGKTKPKFESQLRDEGAYPLRPQIILDSQGFNNYSRQVPDWDSCRRIDILNHLRKAIVYHNNDVLAINKPYGLASHSDSKKDKLDVNTLMQEIASEMRIKKVYLAHRLDKTTTGVLLFATSQERADQLNKLFKSDLIKKTYWCITRGVPDPMEAIIDIPIGEFSVAGKIRSCLAPERIEKERQMTKRYREARRAITEYSVIQSHKQVSLVEVKPRTGVKHQIRCHLGFGLNKPILGDHKYSHLGKLAPQELSKPVLNLLHLRQAKVRTLPIHLHAKTVVIPSVKPNGQNLFIEAKLPPHFKQNLKNLGLLSREVVEKL